ncbi:MAG: hypothetical protein ACO3FX_11875, partial [Gemmobacter sp.]
MSPTYAAPPGGHPNQTELLTGRAVFTEAYAVIPRGVMRDIVTSFLPFWEGTRVWVLARPLSGFAESFSHYLMEIAPGGGSDRPEPAPEAEGVLFVVAGARRRGVGGAATPSPPAAAGGGLAAGAAPALHRAAAPRCARGSRRPRRAR